MRTLFLFFLFLTATSSILSGQTATQRFVLETEAERFSLMTQKDTARLKKFLADDLVYLHSNGLTETKHGHLESIGSGNITYKSMDRAPQTRVRVYGKWAITNGSVRVVGILKGNPFDVQLTYSAVYRKKKGRWQLVNWQSSRN